MNVCKADASGLQRCADVLLNGGVAVIPTDTVYGIAAHPKHAEAVERLVAIKERSLNKPIALLAADWTDVRAFGVAFPPKAEELAMRFWPGALTLVLELPSGGFEGFRVPAHEWTRELLRRCGGVLRVSSANLSGEMPAVDAAAALASVGIASDLLADDGTSSGGTASTVVKITRTGEVSVLRQGPIKL